MRKGDINLNDALIAIVDVVFVILVMMVTANAIYSSGENVGTKSSLVYRSVHGMEKIMNAPCVTEERSVFSEKDIKSGSFGCLNLTQTYLFFNPGGDCRTSDQNCLYYSLDGRRTVSMTSEDFSKKVRNPEDNSFRGETIVSPISIHGRETGDRKTGVLRTVVIK